MKKRLDSRVTWHRRSTCGYPRWWLAALPLLLVMACGGDPTLVSTPVRPPHILLISIDTLRADHLGCYGYQRDTSPLIDALAGESVRFATALAPAPWTLPSHAAMLSGMHPFEIGIDNSLRTLPAQIPMLAQVLAEGGYQTAAFVDSKPQGFVGKQRGFGRGFEHYAHAPHRDGLPLRFDIAATVDAALDWLRGERDPTRPFFPFLHTKSVHAVPNDAECQDERCFPYDNPHRFRFISSQEAPFAWTSPEDGAGQRYLWSLNKKLLSGELDAATYPRQRLAVLQALYDSGIYYVDLHLGRLFGELRTQAFFDDTAVVLTADHGEAFLEHSLLMHQEVYDTQLRVPLLVRRAPGAGGAAGGRMVDDLVTLADIPPTVVRLAGLDSPATWTGRPLPLDGAPGVPGEPRDHFAYYLFPDKFSYRSLALRRAEWKLVVHNAETPEKFRQELYNIDRDPGERHPVEGMDELVEELQRALRRQLGREPLAQGAQLLERDLPDLELIRSLGYIE